MKIVLRMSDLRYVAELAERLSGGAVRYGYTSRPGDGEAHYVDGIRRLVWLGRNGGRTNAVAYYFGAAMEWTRLTGVDLAADVAERLLAIRVASFGARGDWGQWGLEGRVDAEQRWQAVNVLAVKNESTGLWFNVVRQGKCFDGDDQIRVYDQRHPHTDYGQFTGGVYQLEELREHRAGYGLVLDGGVADWVLDWPAMAKVHAWLEGFGSGSAT